MLLNQVTSLLLLLAQLLKVLSKSNEKLLAMGACFNERADSHLICVQTADGQYQTQAISIHSQPRRSERTKTHTQKTQNKKVNYNARSV